MNDFLRMTDRAIETHGVEITVKKKGNPSYDPSTGSVTSSDLIVKVKAYPKHIKASQWSYPNLIGKDVVMFYISGSSSVVPDVTSEITYETSVYKIESIQKHIALGKVCLYRVLSVKA